jgi:FkbM family methyltransferase
VHRFETAIRDFGAEVFRHVFGRRRLVRAGEALMNAGRLASVNDLAFNGEQLLQRAVVARCESEFAGSLVAFDVGANVGRWTSALLAHCRQASVEKPHVHAFEPATECCKEIEQTVWAAGRDRHVTLVAKALAATSSTREFYIVPGSSHISSLIPQFESPGEVRTVETATVDGYCTEHNITRIHLLKIDAEGTDLDVLRGARGVLERRAVEVLQFEYNHRWILSRSYLRDVFELLDGMGYQLGVLTPQGVDFLSRWHHRLEDFREVNYVACLPEVVRWIRVPRIGTPDVRYW